MLASDVNQAEQAELQRMEDGWESPAQSEEIVRSEEESPGDSGPASAGAVQSERAVPAERMGSLGGSNEPQRPPIFGEDSDDDEFGVDTELPVPPTYPEPRHATIKEFVKSVKKIMAGRNGIVTYQTGWKGYNTWHMCVLHSPLPLPLPLAISHTYLLLPWKLLPYHHQCLPTHGLCSHLPAAYNSGQNFTHLRQSVSTAASFGLT